MRCPGCPRRAGDASGCGSGLGREGRSVFVGSGHVPGQIVVGFVYEGWGLCSTVGAQSCLSRQILQQLWTWGAVTPPVWGWDVQHQALGSSMLAPATLCHPGFHSSCLLFYQTSEIASDPLNREAVPLEGPVLAFWARIQHLSSLRSEELMCVRAGICPGCPSACPPAVVGHLCRLLLG